MIQRLRRQERQISRRSPVARRRISEPRALVIVLGTVLLLAVLVSPAEATRTVLLPYGSGGYRYMVVDRGAVSGFEQPDFDDASFNNGIAPFGSTGECELYQTVQTHWPPDTELLVRRTIDVPSGATGLLVGIAIDNDVEVYWNGTRIGADVHEFCATFDSYVYGVTEELVQSSNVLAVRATDRGGPNFLDIEVSGSIGTAERPISKSDCKNGGWKRYGGFKNQGACVSFVAHGGSSPFPVSQRFTVDANAVPGAATGIVLRDGDGDGDGDEVTVTATGTVCIPWACVGPDGDPSYPTSGDSSFLLPAAPAWGLVGRVGDGPWTHIGTGPTLLSGTGELVLAVNDDVYGDNYGSYTVTVSSAR